MDDHLLEKITRHSQRENLFFREKKGEDKGRRGDISQPVCLSADYFLPHEEPVFISVHRDDSNKNVHYHDFFEINYVIRGRPVGIIDGYEIQFGQGNLLLMNPNAVHFYRKYRDGEDVILNIVLPVETFRKTVYLPLLSDKSLNAFFIRYKVENQKRSSSIFLPEVSDVLEQVIEMLIREYLEKKSFGPVIIESLITLLFSHILRDYGASPVVKESPVNDILNYIYRHYNQCGLNDLADKFGYHPKYLSSLIRRHTGRSYRQLLVDIRLQNAAQYLLHSDRTIDEVFEVIGYQDKSSFYQSFKKQFGLSPGRYREENRIT